MNATTWPPELPAAPWARAETGVAAIDPPFFRMGTLLLLGGTHAALALAMDRWQFLATAHALIALAVGLVVVWGRQSHRALYVCGYIASADVLWRMTKAQVFWEFGKYSLTLVALLLVWRNRGRGVLTQLAMLYLVLLVPGVLLAVNHFGLSDNLRQELSFNLSGPVALAAAVVMCSSLGRPFPDLGRLIGWMILPIVGVFAISFYSTLTSTSLDFSNQANFTTSGGYGPNQVSAVLGLGGFLCLLMALNVVDRPLRYLLLLMAAAFQLQTILTFSRGGTFNVVIALVLLSVHYVRQPRARRLLIPILIGGTLISVFLLLPKLNAWTSGSFAERYTNVDSTGRRSLAEADLDLFRANPLFGVGAGLSKFSRSSADRRGIASHTEFTRLLAEHGIFGLTALGLLLLIALIAYRRASSLLTKAWVISLAAWSLAEMSHSAMRVASISFVFGLATLAFHRILPPTSPSGDSPATSRVRT